MGTNFYWKKIPSEIKKICTKENRFHYIYDNSKTFDTFADAMSIFKHIGKRSSAGLYCTKCGITQVKDGSREIHNRGIDITLLFEKEGMSEELKAYNRRLYEQQKRETYFDKCPCCGADMNSPNKDVEQVCSFTWSMFLHKKIIQKYLDSDKKMIIDEYDNEFTCQEFLEEELNNTVYEHQHAWEFC